MRALVMDDIVQLVEDRRGFRSPDGAQHPPNAWDRWTAEDWRRHFGDGARVLPVLPAGPPSFGHRQVGPPIPALLMDGTAVHMMVMVEPRPLDEVKAELRRQLADRRWRAETAGILYADRLVQTDDRTKFMLAAAAQRGQAVSWKFADGSFAPVTGAQLAALFDAVAAHVQDCFIEERERGAAIDAAATLADLAVIAAGLDAGWPNQR